MKYAGEYLFSEIDKYKEVYKACDKYEKIHFKSRLKLYEWQFKNQKDFLKWYLTIIAS